MLSAAEENDFSDSDEAMRGSEGERLIHLEWSSTIIATLFQQMKHNYNNIP